MPKEVRAYKCKWCDTVTLDPGQAEQLEHVCLNNPAFAACANCAHNQETVTPRFQGYSVPVRVCRKPPTAGLVWNDPHNYGWCPNWERSQQFGGKA